MGLRRDSLIIADEVITEREDRILIARLNRPLARNALNTALLVRLRDVLTEAATDDGVSVLVLGSTSVSAFSAGMDTKEALAPGASTLDLLLEVQWAVESFPKPLVGVFAGYVIGGGAEVALSADIRIGSSSTVFSFPGTGYGLAQGSWHLPDVVGSSRARELVLSGRRVDAQECLRLGLLHEIDEDSEGRSLARARDLVHRSDSAMQTSKRLILAADAKSRRQRFEDEQSANRSLMATEGVEQRMNRTRRATPNP